MKHIAILALACIAALILVACTATVADAPTQQSQAASTVYEVINGSTGMPLNATRFCRAYYMGGNGGHAGSPIWPTGVPKYGSSFGAFPPTLAAWPYSTSLGTAGISALCQDKADFGITGAQTSDASPPYLLWNTSYGSAVRDGTVALWNQNSFCWLNGVNGLSTPNEIAEVFPPPSGTGNWTLHAAGVPVLGASAKCITPDRSWSMTGPIGAWGGHVGVGSAVATSFCGLTYVGGTLDDGYIYIYQAWGYWVLEVPASVYAEMRCAVF